MPTPVRLTAMFNSDEGRGFSESHIKQYDNPPGNLQPVLADYKAFIEQFRIPLLARDRYCYGLKVSYGTRKDGIKSSPFVYDKPRYPANQREGCGPSLAVKVRMGEIGNTHFSDIYLRGFWDVVEQDEHLDFTTQAGNSFKTLLDQYTAAAVARQYGWEGTSEVATRRGTVDSYTNQPDGRVRFSITIGSGPALPAVGQLLSMRVAGLNNGNSILNTTHVVKVIDADTVETVQLTAALVFQSAGTFVITGKGFFQYTGVQYYKLGRRPEGNAFGVTPGRLPARARG